MGRNLYDVSAAVWSHWPAMNAVRELERMQPVVMEPESFRDLIAYLYYLNYNTEPGDASRGANVFQGRGCARCHALEPQQAAGKAGRAVYHMELFQQPIALAVAVWNHGGEMIRKMAELGVSWPQFEAREVADLIAFLRASSSRAAQDS